MLNIRIKNKDYLICAIEGAKLHRALGTSDRVIKKKLAKAIELNIDYDVPKKKRTQRYEQIQEAKRIINETSKMGGLENRTYPISAIIAFIITLIFLTANLTGNVIGGLTQDSSNFIGAGFFILGLLGTYLYFINK